MLCFSGLGYAYEYMYTCLPPPAATSSTHSGPHVRAPTESDAPTRRLCLFFLYRPTPAVGSGDPYMYSIANSCMIRPTHAQAVAEPRDGEPVQSSRRGLPRQRRRLHHPRCIRPTVDGVQQLQVRRQLCRQCASMAMHVRGPRGSGYGYAGWRDMALGQEGI